MEGCSLSAAMPNNRKTGAPKPQAVGAMRVAQAAKKVNQKNPRRVRILKALLTRPHMREELDKVAGASNVPDIMMRIGRELRIEFKCEHVDSIDRDGLPCRPGLYSLTEEGREEAFKWLQSDAGTANDFNYTLKHKCNDEDDGNETVDQKSDPRLVSASLLAIAALFSEAGPVQRAPS
jgi:hypothetical protein